MPLYDYVNVAGSTTTFDTLAGLSLDTVRSDRPRFQGTVTDGLASNSRTTHDSQGNGQRSNFALVGGQ